MTIRIYACQYCAGTGENYRPGLAGDGWGEGDCWNCEGFGSVVSIDGEEFTLIFPRGADKPVYRDSSGRFRSIPEEAWMAEEV